MPWIKKIGRWLLPGAALLALFYMALYFIPFPDDRLHPAQAYRYYDRHGELIGILISDDEFYRMHIPLSEISALFIKTLLLKEDQYFYHHFGVNPLAVVRAVFSNLSAGKIVSGGSTISMQLARMLERRPRTFSAKLIETFRAMQLELHYTKSEILAYYLALAPYGGNLEGLQAAAYEYFGKPASILSPGEIALLVSIPKSPNRYRPDRYPHIAEQTRNKMLHKMHAANLIDDSQLERSLRESIPSKRVRIKNIMPHTAWHLRKQYADRYVYQTTLDGNVQRRVTELLKNYVASLKSHGISNASAVVIDNHTREIRAAVGSTDYFSNEALGANDGTYAARSPGSTLKPFLYGLAMQQGLISEKTILYDLPLNYAGYAPQNYSKNFIGPVTAREALIESLNVVAVELNNRLGIERLHNLLKEGGIGTLDQPAAYYGLPLVLGGVEVRLIELSNLYASLANGGIYKPYKLLRSEIPSGPEKKLLSPEASWLLTHIMTDVERPDFPSSWEFSKNRPTVAWKTGTSYGHQDAWSVGYTPRLTIGVWLGNFDGRPANALAGSGVAAPLLFDLFQALDDPSDHQWFHKPADIRKRQVCAACGTRANRHCKTFATEYFIANIVGPATQDICDIPQEIVLDTRSGLQANHDTPVMFTRKQVFEIWPSEMASFLLKHGIPVRDAPPYELENMAGQKYYPPKILSPVANTIYYKRLDKLNVADHGIKLSAAVTNRVRAVNWYLNGEHIAKIDPKEDIIINPPFGRHQLLLVDDTGGSSSVELLVKDFRELALNNAP